MLPGSLPPLHFRSILALLVLHSPIKKREMITRNRFNTSGMIRLFTCKISTKTDDYLPSDGDTGGDNVCIFSEDSDCTSPPT